MKQLAFSIAAFALLLSCPVPGSARGPATQVKVTYPASVAKTFTGRVYLFLGNGRDEPRFGPNWFSPSPFYAVDVVDWKPDTPLDLSGTPLGFPKPLSELRPRRCKVQAVMRLNPHARQVGRGVGNAYSDVVSLDLTEGGGNVALEITHVVPPKPFVENERTKEHRVRSALLSEFHGRDVYVQAAVVLPKGFNPTSERKYPTLYLVPGFGDTHHEWGRYARDPGAGHEGDIVRVVLDPSCGGGHHVFADSANNGPWASALVTEFIPSLEKAYPLVGESRGRYLSGISSGGWSSLWLQVTQPTFFGGVWSFAPDPVDFRDFQQINLYKRGTNMLKDAKGKRRPLARHGGRVMVWYDDFVAMETVLGDGAQIRSFEWVFSPRGEDGNPKDVFDRKTGKVDTDVAKTWEKYDIQLLLKKNWSKWKKHLSGKLNVFMGGQDTFYLDGATRLLKTSLKKLKSDAVVEVHEKHDHSSIYSRDMRARVDRELIEKFRKDR